MVVEVAVAFRQRQIVEEVELDAGATVGEAIERSGLAERFPELEIRSGRVGVFGKLQPLDHPLAPGDRVEIYRPLAADPKEVRRRLAELERERGD